MSKKDPELRSVHDARHALMCLGYTQKTIDQFVPDPDNQTANPIVGQPNPRQRRILVSALRTQRDSLEKRVGRASVSVDERSNIRADLDTTKELIATLQL